ncbi:hypothetical protein AQUCO_00900315v1 [Aquilegia coerulea]|uniref:Mur ligase central domain-containing protein n=1 Tax=Aquilegia coerulea TaxID=218851 RepID=A0A2G5ED13_AQUCA|nr:hypothetical protein AQUCO_00900315v1 [Aquilegia coerulea]
MNLATCSHKTLTSRSISISPAHKVVPFGHGRIISCCAYCNEDLKGQTVAVVGLGVSGRSAAKLALARGASVIAIDKNENLVPLEQDSAFEKHGYLKTVLGNCDRQLLETADRVVVSPGVPIENYGILSLLQSGKRVMSELDFAAELLPKCIKILAVTGTNGKSTVTTFAGQMLCQLGIKAFVGGNLGNPLSEAVIQCLASPIVNPEFQVAVVEVSSYQMEIPNTHFCPSVGVILNFTPDHLERHQTMKNYAATKSRLFSHMSFSKLAILPVGNQHLNEALKDYEDKCNVAWIGSFPGVKVDMEKRIADFKHPSTGMISRLQLGTLKAVGSHNFYNAAVAAFSVLNLDVEVDIDSIGSTIELLRPLPHRMQIVRKDAHGVTWVDDSKATNVEAAYTGISALKEQKSVVLLGGVAKVLNAEGDIGFGQLVEPLEYHRCIITVNKPHQSLLALFSNE